MISRLLAACALALLGASGLAGVAAAASICCYCAPKTSPAEKLCVKGDYKTCAELVNDASNPGLQTLKCDVILKPTECQKKPAGVCPAAPEAADKYAPAATSTGNVIATMDLAAPTLDIPIPGLTFATRVTSKGGFFDIPFLAQYVSAVNTYLIGISILAAAVMIAYGGFKYIVSSSVQGVQGGREIIRDATIGLVLVLGITTMVRLINPDLMNLNALKIREVTQGATEIGNFSSEISPGRAEDEAAAQSGGPPPEDVPDVARALIRGAKAAGVDPCVILAMCKHESNLKAISWNGIQAKRPKDKAIAFGPCGIYVSNITKECPPTQNNCNVLSAKLRAKFPDFPPPPAGATMTAEEKMLRADWLMNNVEGSGYLAALIFRAQGSNELWQIAGYGAGLASIKQWAKAHSCTPKAGAKIKDALSNSEAAMREACIPDVVAVYGKGDPPQACPDDKYECSNVKINSASEFVGNCASNPNQKCYAMKTTEHLDYVFKNYKAMQQKYQCDI